MAIDPSITLTWRWSACITPLGAADNVRTRAEWTYVGMPDLGSLSKRAILVEWQTFPDQSVNPRFPERLAGELGALGVKLDDDLFFICRSGGRSLAAAKAMAAMGYRACHNVAGGFEGPLNDGKASRAPSEVGRRLVSPGCKASGGCPPLQEPALRSLKPLHHMSKKNAHQR
jgi:rhodanese-related sulfurtransferase